MSDYSTMTEAQLIKEMEAWRAVVDSPKGPANASNGAREEAGRQMYLAEAWYRRVKQEEVLE